MRINRVIKHSAFISKMEGKPFEWGTLDCMQFLFAWYDAVFNTKLQEKIYQQYNSPISAMKFWKDYPMTVKQWMYLRKFDQINNDDPSKEGDVRIVEQKKYPSAYIYHNGYWFGVEEGHKVSAYTVNAFRRLPHTTWRHK